MNPDLLDKETLSTIAISLQDEVDYLTSLVNSYENIYNNDDIIMNTLISFLSEALDEYPDFQTTSFSRERLLHILKEARVVQKRNMNNIKSIKRKQYEPAPLPQTTMEPVQSALRTVPNHNRTLLEDTDDDEDLLSKIQRMRGA